MASSSWVSRIGRAFLSDRDGSRGSASPSDGDADERSAVEGKESTDRSSPPDLSKHSTVGGLEGTMTAPKKQHPAKPTTASESSRSADIVSSYSGQAGKRKNLAAILSTPLDGAATAAAAPASSSRSASQIRSSMSGGGVPERRSRVTSPLPLPLPRPPSREAPASSDGYASNVPPDQSGGCAHSAGSLGSDSSGPDATGRSPSRLSSTLSQGVKALHDRYTSSREASETFRNMRVAHGDDMVDGSSTSDGSQRCTLSAEATSTVEWGGADTTSANAADISSSASTAPVRFDGVFSPEAPAVRTERSSNPPAATEGQITIPEQLAKGDVALKVTKKKVMQRVVRIDPDLGQIIWDSKKNNSSESRDGANEDF